MADENLSLRTHPYHVVLCFVWSPLVPMIGNNSRVLLVRLRLELLRV